MIRKSPHPSYAQGYARNAAESEAPGLWKGLKGLWLPTLGPTGLTLRDHSGFGKHGLTDEEAIWKIGVNGPVLQYSTTISSQVKSIVSDYRRLDGQCTIVMRCRLLQNANNTHRLLKLISDDANQPHDISLHHTNTFGVPDIQFSWAAFLGAKITTTTTFSDADRIYTIAARRTGSTGAWSGDIFVDGVIQPVTRTGMSNNPNAGNDNRRLVIGTNASFAGLRELDSLQLYDRPLSDAEAQQLYDKPAAMFTRRRRVFAAVVAPAVGNPWYHYAQQAAITG